MKLTLSIAILLISLSLSNAFLQRDKLHFKARELQDPNAAGGDVGAAVSNAGANTANAANAATNSILSAAAQAANNTAAAVTGAVSNAANQTATAANNTAASAANNGAN
jgi:hypothetical protein